MTHGTRDLPDEQHMARALELAREGWGQVSPNPLVGAVLVSGGRVIGEGFHASFGADHAEVVALGKGGLGGADGTLYVTLEPCAHHGKTPPCTQAILKAGVARVVIGCKDPSEAGGGARFLRDAGLEVVAGVRSMEAARLNGPFIWDHLGDSPWVSLKLGLSLDGRIAAGAGIRTEITGPESARYVHELRSAHDAVLVGGRTALVDDPLLTVRLVPAPRVPPTRVVLDPDLQLPVASRLVESAGEAPLLVVCRQGVSPARRKELERREAEVVPVTAGAHGLDLAAVLRELGSRGVRSIMAEGGGRLAAALLAGNHVRRQHLIYAPIVLGIEGVPGIGTSFATAEADGWHVVGRQKLGDDTLLELEDRRARDALTEVA